MSDEAAGGDAGAPDEAQVPENELSAVELDELSQPLQEAAKRAGWPKLMPVQRRAIPYLQQARDVMVQSRTGSGKTGAFLLPLLARLDPEKKVCQCLILVPTRELARQVANEWEKLVGGESDLRCVAVYGGVGYKQQLDAFKAGTAVVVGTPGRILDHLLRRSLTLDELSVLVFDEADRMLSMGFYPDMREIRSYLPPRHINSAMFSATFPPHVMRLAKQFLREPAFLSLSHDGVAVAETAHIYYQVDPMEKDRALVRIIEIENPTNALIFCNTKSHVHYVSVVLQRFGYDADEISSDLNQSAREKVLSRIHAGKLRFLVATDVAARGLDIPELSHVFQYDVPDDMEAYIHRAGRTGRAGASGVAMTLAAGMDLVELKRIAKRYKIEFEDRKAPTEADVQAVMTERLTALLEARFRGKDQVERERLRRFAPLAKSLVESEEESAVVAMLLEDFYEQTVHGRGIPVPEPVVAPEEEPAVEDSSGGQDDSRSGGKRRKRGRRKK